MGRKGGIASGKVRREKKRISQILSEYLQKEHNIILRNENGVIIKTEKLSAPELIDRTITEVLSRGDSASVSMIKEIREATEKDNDNDELTQKLDAILSGVKDQAGAANR